MDKIDKYISSLKADVEKIIGRKLCSHGDFTQLSDDIFQNNKDMISPTTLKRLWGYLKQESPSPQTRTLNVLASFIGFTDWLEYCNYQKSQNNYSSEFVEHHTQHCFLMKPGEKIRVSWHPGRKLVLRHEGDSDLFTVISSEGSKLEAGMTVHCESFTENEILTLKNVKGVSLTGSCDYICGKIGGIAYEMIGN